MSDELGDVAEAGASDKTMRLAVVLHPNLESGAAANVAAIVAGGLRCDAFESPILDADGHQHAAIRWNVVVLKARSAAHLKKVLSAARNESVQAVAFTTRGQELSNSFGQYKAELSRQNTEALDVVAVGLYGPDHAVRSLTRPFSLFR